MRDSVPQKWLSPNDVLKMLPECGVKLGDARSLRMIYPTKRAVNGLYDDTRPKKSFWGALGPSKLHSRHGYRFRALWAC